MMLCWLGNRVFSRKKSAQLSTSYQMPLKDLVLRRKEGGKAVLFCFAEKKKKELAGNIKPTERNV